MSKKNKRNLKKPLFLSAIFVVLGLGVVIILLNNRNEMSLEQREQQTAEEIDSDNAKKQADLNLSESDVPLKEGDSNNNGGPNETVVKMSRLSFSQANGLINSSVDIEGANAGMCSFIFTDRDGRAITKKAELTSGSCSISVSEAEFSMIGQYDLTAKFNNSSTAIKVEVN